jgi:hypothetical protein
MPAGPVPLCLSRKRARRAFDLWIWNRSRTRGHSTGRDELAPPGEEAAPGSAPACSGHNGLDLRLARRFLILTREVIMAARLARGGQAAGQKNCVTGRRCRYGLASFGRAWRFRRLDSESVPPRGRLCLCAAGAGDDLARPLVLGAKSFILLPRRGMLEQLPPQAMPARHSHSSVRALRPRSIGGTTIH